jgi:hypothetical protein
MSSSGLAQSPKYGVGRTPSAEEIRAWDISIGPTGEEIPPGRGSAKEGSLPIGDAYASVPEWKPRTPRLKGYPY